MISTQKPLDADCVAMVLTMRRLPEGAQTYLRSALRCFVRLQEAEQGGDLREIEATEDALVELTQERDRLTGADHALSTVQYIADRRARRAQGLTSEGRAS